MSIIIKQLRCNDESNYIGIIDPVFSWRIESNMKNIKQVKYVIQVGLDQKFEEIIWNYEKYSDETVDVTYKGPKLDSKTRYFVRVKSFIHLEESTDWSETIFFETPILNHKEWLADWIKPKVVQYKGAKSFRQPFIASKNFSAGKKRVDKARLYISSLGIYKAKLNNKEIGNDYFRPGFTDYNHRIQFQSYDVTNLLKKQNNLSVTVSEGWYSGHLGTDGWSGNKEVFGNNNALIAQLEITYEDGSCEVIKTDPTWEQKFGPILYSDFYNGEWYDSTKLETLQGNMLKFSYPKGDLIPQEGPSVKCVTELKPIKLFKDSEDSLILDMGQNMVGWIRFKNSQITSNKVVLSHAEVLDKDGKFYTDNLRGAESKDTYIVNPNDENYFEPHFTFHGFRYVKLEGFEEDVNIDNFRGVVLSSAIESIGKFKTGNERINRLQQNILWGLRGNFVDIPSDCPQRDERQGWTADAQIFLPTATFNVNVKGFFKKWLKDLSAGQKDQNGAVPFIVPDILKGGGVFCHGKADTTAAWGDAATICPWVLYEEYGDKSILETQYQSMQNWIDFVRREGTNEHLWDTGLQLADWLGLDSKEDSFYGATEGGLVATAYFAKSTEIFANSARVLGKMEDFKSYHELYLNIKQNFQDKYVKNGNILTSNTQTAHVLALQFGLIDKENEQIVADNLAKLINKNNNHLDTGFLGTPYICHVLSKYGYLNLAYTLLYNDDFPSWLYQVDNGATTMWEHWDSRKEDGTFWSEYMNSFNHYAYGSIGDWMYKTIGGISSRKPGFKKSVISPKPEKKIGNSLCSLTTMYGELSCEWTLMKNMISISVVIPPNTDCLIILPSPKDNEGLKKQIKKTTNDLATFTDGKIRAKKNGFLEGKYTETAPWDEKEIFVSSKDLGFELGSGQYTFNYELSDQD